MSICNPQPHDHPTCVGMTLHSRTNEFGAKVLKTLPLYGTYSSSMSNLMWMPFRVLTRHEESLSLVVPGSRSLQRIQLKRCTLTAKIQGRIQVKKFGFVSNCPLCRGVIRLRRKGCLHRTPYSAAVSEAQGRTWSFFFIVGSFECGKDIAATINRKLYPCVARASLDRELSRRSEHPPFP
jgi:hypothetical protein